MGRFMFVFFAFLWTMGCSPHHIISFHDISYTIESPRQNVGILVVIDQNTLGETVPIRSFMTGIAHSWDAKPGEMLGQIADVEFPQMFTSYERSSQIRESNISSKSISLQLTVPHYAFDQFHAFVEVQAMAYGPGKALLFDKSYSKEGETQGAKMFFGGAFGMKSAIRQSSFDAYKQVFAELRSDLLTVLKDF